MDKSLIYQAIGRHDIPENLSVEELERLSAAYPWFSLAQVLLAKAYQQKNDHRFTDQLHRAALHSGDRAVLYKYIKAKPIPAQPEPIETISLQVQMPPEVTPAPAIEFTAPPVVIEENVANKLLTPELEEEIFYDVFSPLQKLDERRQNEPSNETPIIPIQEDMDKFLGDLLDKEEKTERETETEETETETEETETETERREEREREREREREEERETPPTIIKASELDDLEREILVEAVSSTIELEAEEDQEEDPGTEEPNAPIADDYTRWLLKRSAQLHYGDSSSIQENEEEKETEVKASKPTLRPNSEAQLSYPVAGPRIEAQDKKTKQQNLIDRFIRQDPKITPGKVSDYAPGNIARESLEEDMELVTETMAKLFAAQGKIDKAKKAYRKLMELFPEKSVYFAAQLKNLNSTKKG